MDHCPRCLIHGLKRPCVLAAFVMPCLLTNIAFGLDVERVVWGFDGRVVAHRFNLLSVEVANNDAQPFDGALEIRKTSGGGPRIGARIIERVFVAPYTRRWVQFYLYVMNDWEEWTLTQRTGRTAKRLRLDLPKLSERARIILVAEDDPFASSGGLKQFPENLFPPMVTATDSLEAVVLDHVPRWENARVEAFVDWLRRGGRVHICQNGDGQYPQFPESLAVLNSPIDQNRVGSGLVTRHARKLSQFDTQFVHDQILQPADSQQATNDDAAKDDEIDDDESYNDYGWSIQDGFFKDLKQMTRPEHNWTAIHLLSLTYILLIFPGCYLLGRRRADYKITNSVVLGLVLIAVFGFQNIGRRGYGESTAVNTLAIARPLQGDYFDVTQWTNAFVIDGADYRISHQGTGRIYSTAQNAEAVPGLIDNGLDGTFDVDIPPYSNCSFKHRSKLKAKRIQLNVETWEADATLENLVLTTDDSFPENSKQVYALYRDRVYHMSHHDGRLAKATKPQNLRDFLRLNEYNELSNNYYVPWEDEPATRNELFSRLHHPLIAASLGIFDQSRVSEVSLPDDRVRVFIFALLTGEFFTTGDQFDGNAGYVLYCIDVFNPEEP